MVYSSRPAGAFSSAAGFLCTRWRYGCVDYVIATKGEAPVLERLAVPHRADITPEESRA
jgi:hypothetical protein